MVSKSFLEPLNEIKSHRHEFIMWLVTIMFLGTVGIWLPIIWKNVSMESAIADVASFNIVLLAECFAAATSIKSGVSKESSSIRTIGFMIAIFLIILNVGVILEGAQIFWVFVITLLVIMFASYLYCFRYASWEESADKIVQKEDDEIADLSKKAKNIKSDENGVKI